MLTVSFSHGIVMQGMGKYFVLLAREAGYERTLLQLGRHIRYSSSSYSWAGASGSSGLQLDRRIR